MLTCDLILIWLTSKKIKSSFKYVSFLWAIFCISRLLRQKFSHLISISVGSTYIYLLSYCRSLVLIYIRCSVNQYKVFCCGSEELSPTILKEMEAQSVINQ